MNSRNTNEKNPARGGIDELHPMLPSTRRCVWKGPETDHGRFDLKEQVERALQRLDKALWVLDSQNLDNPSARLEAARRDIILAMDQALAVETLLFVRHPEDQIRQSTTWYFDSSIKR